MIQKHESVNRLRQILQRMNGEGYRFRSHFVFDVNVDDTWRIQRRCIDDWLFTYIHSGQAVYSIEGQQHHVAAGSLIMITHGIEHFTWKDRGVMRAMGIRFAPYRVDQPFKADDFPRLGFHYRTQHPIRHFHHMTSILNYANAADPLAQQMLHHAVYNLLGDMVLELSNQAATGGQYDWYRVDEYINQHMQDPIAMHSLADLYNLSAKYFCQLYRQQTGTTVKRQIYIKRMEYAKYLLTETADDVQQIGWKVGYSDPFIFSNQFKRYWGIAPTHFRMNNHLQDGF